MQKKLQGQISGNAYRCCFYKRIKGNLQSAK